VSGETFTIFRLDALPGTQRLPFTHKVLLENLLRTEDGANVTAAQIQTLANWDAQAEPTDEIQFTPARVIMQDFTGVPCVVDLATMREAFTELGGDPNRINPLAPAELVIDHSVIADFFGNNQAEAKNVDCCGSSNAVPVVSATPSLMPNEVVFPPLNFANAPVGQFKVRLDMFTPPPARYCANCKPVAFESTVICAMAEVKLVRSASETIIFFILNSQRLKSVKRRLFKQIGCFVAQK
jgi:hypothetical protein